MKRILPAILALTIAANASALTVAKPTNPPHPVVNINTATEAQFLLLPGVGPKLAAALNDAAETGKDASCDHKCQFKSVDDLLRVKGIGPAKLAAMRPYVVLTGATTAVVKIKAAKAVTK